MSLGKDQLISTAVKNVKAKAALSTDRNWESNPSTPVLKRLGPGRVGPRTIPEFLDGYQ